MRIGLVCPYSLTIPGGVQAQVLGLGRALRAQGHPTRVLAPCDGPPPDGWVTPLGNSMPTAANGSVAPLAPDLSAQLRLIRAANDEDFDVINVHEPLGPGVCITTLVVKPAPLVGTFHAAGVSGAYKTLGPVVRWLAGRLDLRCAVSADAEDLARTHLRGTYERVYNAIEIPLFAEAEPTPTDGTPTILFLGRHDERKGLEVLLDAVADLPRDIRLWIAGDGPDTARLQRRTSGDPRIEWLGRISDADKASRLRAATVYCAPSLRGESFGVVLLEAMAAGVPIVCSDLPGYRKVVRADADALLFAPGDTAGLARAVTAVLTDRDRAAALVASGRQRAETFSMDALATRYLELYAKVV
ncbi:glycosyltransferase family 4 protein [Iamia sp. SCSIO 61187]|uniref:glycosyltransferase family 4 protein n=1 Tax=Iamia sp. SCSIO 61187 TaxID=2722752 RepID=UPI001C636793|nr:glycosyltransferase family 4 protein [Iamia sp. SCSIO 61187]QYG93411.1 glycosyltransferase family 4 protein [Iamia sp. SCSIO 61187]